MKETNIVQVIILAILIGTADVAYATISGVPPNSTGDTVIDEDTIWENESVTTSNLYVRNMSQRVSFEIYNSSIIIDGFWILGGDGYNIGADIKIINSTLIFNASGVVGDHDGQVVDSAWFEGKTWGTIDRSRYILIGGVLDPAHASKFEMRGSHVKGISPTVRANGIMISGNPNPQTVIVTDSGLFFLGGSYQGSAYYALNLHPGDTGAEARNAISNNSELKNITFNYVGRGIAMPSKGEYSQLTDSRFVGGGGAINNGKYFDNITLDGSWEPLGQLRSGVIFKNSWIDALHTKLNFDTTNADVYNNTISRASINLGDGGDGPTNNKFHNNIVYDSGAGSRRGTNEVYNNTMIFNAGSGRTDIFVVGGHSQYWHNNTIIADKNDNTLTAFHVEPHELTVVGPYGIDGRLGNNLIRDNTISGVRYSFYINKQFNLTLINNKITDMQEGYNNHFKINNSSDVKIIDMDLNDPTALLYDIVLANSDDVKFINTKFNESKIGLSGPKDIFNVYYYLDAKVVDSNSNPIPAATVTITNNIDTNYPSINIDGEIKHSFTTGMDGHTPLPSNPASSAAILDFWKTSTTQQEMTYTITASYSGYTNSTTVTPDASWHRTDPNTYQNTVVITLPIIVTPSAIDINQDGTIDISDLRIVALHFGESTTSPYPRYDVNADGTVDILDLRQVAGGM